jgi:ribosomal protein S18 acetylase RimI-like enzyme
VLRQPDGTGHVRGVAVAESQRGRGLGRELSRALTRAAMADSGVCSLGVYVDNEPALRTYRSLGYEVVHTFTSGPVSESPSTTASAPSR